MITSGEALYKQIKLLIPDIPEHVRKLTLVMKAGEDPIITVECFIKETPEGVTIKTFKLVEEVECRACRIGHPLQYRAGYGWFHHMPDGGPDIECTNPKVVDKPNPEGEE